MKCSNDWRPLLALVSWCPLVALVITNTDCTVMIMNTSHDSTGDVSSLRIGGKDGRLGNHVSLHFGFTKSTGGVSSKIRPTKFKDTE